MFQAVRLWWGGGRGKTTVRLFVFEFVVVLAGVLAAQALAGYAQRRADLAHMEEERARVRYELESAHSIFQTWRAAIPCLNDRLTEVMNGHELSSAELQRPALVTPNYEPPDPLAIGLIAQRHGVEEKNRLKSVADGIRALVQRDELIISTWGRLMLLDPANGPISEADRAEARVAAAEIKGYLRSIDIISDAALGTLERLGIPARNNDEPDHGPARSCAAIWKSARIDPPLTMN